MPLVKITSIGIKSKDLNTTFRVDDAGPIWSAMWVFCVGPCVGALLAVFVYEKAYAALPGAAAPSAAAAPPQQEARTEPTAA